MDTQTTINILTAVLAVATVWLAVATQLMARATKKAVELEAAPYLSFSELKIVIGKMPDIIAEVDRKSFVRLGIAIRNPGKVRVQYEVQSLRMTFNAITVENPTFITPGGYIFPGEVSVYWYGTLQLKGDVGAPSQGTAAFEILYWSSDARKKATLSQRLNFSLLSLEPPYVEWLNTYENHKT